MPSMPSMDTLIMLLQASTGPVHLSRAFIKVRDRSKLSECWNLAGQDLSLSLAEPQAAAYLLASNISFINSSASKGSQGHCVGAGVNCTKPSMQLKADPCGISASTSSPGRSESQCMMKAVQIVRTQCSHTFDLQADA